MKIIIRCWSTWTQPRNKTAVFLNIVCYIYWIEADSRIKGQRRIPVQYAKRVVGRKVYGGQSTHIPIKVNSAGVIPCNQLTNPHQACCTSSQCQSNQRNAAKRMGFLIVLLFAVIALAAIVAVVAIQEGQRRIPVQYASADLKPKETPIA